MMRKLAVTVFAMSLTLIGCGSSSTSKKDAAGDGPANTDVAPKLDVVATPDTTPTPSDALVLTDVKPGDAGADTLVATDTTPKADVSGDITPTTDTRDGSPAERGPDTVVVVRLDATPDTVVTATDAPVDSAPVSGDAGLEAGGDAETD